MTRVIVFLSSFFLLAPGITWAQDSAPADYAPLVTRDPFELPALLKQAIEAQELAKQGQGIQTPTGTVVVQPPPMTLQGILWGTTRPPQAIINRRIVSDGESVGDVVIKGINKDSVEFSFQGKEFRLELPQRTAQSNKL